MYCRFCFRKERLNEDEAGYPHDDLAPALAYVAAHPAIHEVILTGGDPLVLADDKLARLLARIAAIPHVEGIRIHTRVPVRCRCASRRAWPPRWTRRRCSGS